MLQKRKNVLIVEEPPHEILHYLIFSGEMEWREC